MAALTLLAVSVPVAAVGLAQGDPVARWQPEIAAASLRFGVPERWIIAVMRVESGGRTERDGRPLRSPKGAMGLMQLMPGTWRDLRVQFALGNDPDLPADNILAGTAYLRLLYDQFGYPGLFAAYNAGPARYLAWRDRAVPLPAETVAYLRTVLGLLTAPAETQAPLVAARVQEAPWRRLFVPLAGPGQAESGPQ